jgi:hypothetical protein
LEKSFRDLYGNAEGGEILTEKYPLLKTSIKYGLGLTLEPSREETFTASQIKTRGIEGIKEDVESLERQRNFDWMIETYYRIRSQILVKLTGGARSSVLPVQTLEDHKRLAKNLTFTQLKEKIEDVNLQSTEDHEIAETLNSAIFAPDLEKQIETHGTVSINFRQHGEILHEPELRELQALTKEKLQLIEEVAQFFKEVKGIYELEVRQRSQNDERRSRVC